MDTVEIIRKKKIWWKAQGLALSLKKTPDLMPGPRSMSLEKNPVSSHRGFRIWEDVVSQLHG